MAAEPPKVKLHGNQGRHRGEANPVQLPPVAQDFALHLTPWHGGVDAPCHTLLHPSVANYLCGGIGSDMVGTSKFTYYSFYEQSKTASHLRTQINADRRRSTG